MKKNNRCNNSFSADTWNGRVPVCHKKLRRKYNIRVGTKPKVRGNYMER